MHLKSLRLYSLFLVALGYQTEGCVLYKAENRAEENPLPGCVLNRSEELENLYDRPGSVKSEHVHEVEKNCCYHMSCLLKARHCNPARYIAEQGFFDAFVCLYLAYLVLCRCKLSGRDRFSAR